MGLLRLNRFRLLPRIVMQKLAHPLAEAALELRLRGLILMWRVLPYVGILVSRLAEVSQRKEEARVRLLFVRKALHLGIEGFLEFLRCLDGLVGGLS